MRFELFAQANDPAFQAGMLVGILIALFVCASIPIAVGASKKQPVLGVVGGVCAGGTAFLFGCLGGLPVALVFVFIILAIGSPQQPPPPRYRDDDDFEPPPENDRPR